MLVAALLLAAAPALAQTPPATDVHLGVATCAGSTCHGNTAGVKKTGVLQNEYLTWQRLDKHAKAFTVLQGELGKRIAANLGYPSAEKAQVCLDCHSDNVPAEQRGVQFQVSDGVGCEACHGASQKWLGPHASGKIPHAQLVSDYALYPTDDPMARAKLCVSCHVGSGDRFVTHRIMGAGHPRMPFELETFSQIQPAHYQIDEIYKKRKTVAAGVQFWAVGQAVALETLMTSVADPAHKGDGVFPELVFFDCDSCHHPTTSLRWEKRASSGLGPGLPHLNDANAIMLRAIAARIDPASGAELEKTMVSLHAAMAEGKGVAKTDAQSVGAIAHKLGVAFAAHAFTRDDMKAMMQALAARGPAGDYADYAAAEQATMAFASIVYTLKTDNLVDAGTAAKLKTALDQCYAATQKEEAYQPAKFVAAADAVGRSMP
jgi:hypothetical protein